MEQYQQSTVFIIYPQYWHIHFWVHLLAERHSMDKWDLAECESQRAINDEVNPEMFCIGICDQMKYPRVKYSI